jgi:FkbM family methyltransferase
VRSTERDLKAVPLLSEMLAEDPAEADLRATAYVVDRVPDWTRVVLFGAGNNGRTIARRLQKQGVKPLAFIDDTPSKQGASLEGIPIYSEAEVAEKFGSNLSVVVTVLNPRHFYPDTESRLSGRWGWRCLPFLALSWQDGGRYGSVLHLSSPGALLAQADSIFALDNLLQDSESRCELARQIAFRLTLEFSVLQPARPRAYFPSDIPLQLSPDLTFVDAGAYDGDTVVAFVDACRGKFKQVVAIEADPSNFSKLQKNIERQVWGRKVLCHQVALGNKASDTIWFNSTGDMAARVCDSVAEGVAVSSKLLAEVAPTTSPLYIKFDIEGAEWDALTASPDLFRLSKPQLAVSVYHDPTDLWRIPLWLDSVNVGYKFWLRNHGTEGVDVICYGLPEA